MSRRDFLAKSALAGAALSVPAGVFAQGRDQIKVGLIGCGGRGSGAAGDAAAADPGVVIWSMGDVFADRLNGTRNALKNDLKERCQVTDDRCFVGFDAYKQVIASGVDVVILATPPGFRPDHFEAAVEAGKHVFFEKPIATDAIGVRKVIRASELASLRRLSVVAGTQRRHDVAYQQAMQRIHDGAIGDITACYAYWNQGGLWMYPRKAEWSDMEWQLRNWLYFTWLSGDHICEQHIHNLDVCNWAMKAHPVKAVGMGGRQARTNPAYGHVYDHFAIEYEYANGVKMISMCRQIDGSANRVAEAIVGSKGTSNANTWIRGQNAWRFDGDRPNPYVEEHRRLFKSIRAREGFNEGKQVAEATLTAIMGRMAAYTGQEVSWEAAMNSKEMLVPSSLSMGPLPTPPIAIPGQTKLV